MKPSGKAAQILELSERMWAGEAEMRGLGPWETTGLAELAEGLGFILSFANVTAFRTAEGLVLVDTGSVILAPTIHREIRRWSAEPVHTAIYTHGHVDHVFGVMAFDVEADDAGRPRPRVIAHEALPRRFDRYRLTGGYNGYINARQFSLPAPLFPVEYRYPDETYRDQRTLEIGGRTFELFHAKGETDDATWVWVPDCRAICAGDCFVWVSPNCGNPQKVQRYPREWAQALRRMASLEAELLLPGHGPPIQGADRVRQALGDTAAYLESIVEQTLERMNRGQPLAQIVAAVRPPAELRRRPYLAAVYDEPAFIVRNLWRLYGGWYDGDPSHLKPSPPGALAREIADLAGGAAPLAERAKDLAARGRLALAAELAELAAQASPHDPAVLATRRAVYRDRAARERSLMAQGIFRWAAENDPGEP